jgi:SlyX protein
MTAAVEILLEARIVELETKLAFQDHLLEELNEVIVGQQQQLDRLAAKLGLLGRQLNRLAGGGNEARGDHGG